MQFYDGKLRGMHFSLFTSVRWVLSLGLACLFSDVYALNRIVGVIEVNPTQLKSKIYLADVSLGKILSHETPVAVEKIEFNLEEIVNKTVEMIQALSFNENVLRLLAEVSDKNINWLMVVSNSCSEIQDVGIWLNEIQNQLGIKVVLLTKEEEAILNFKANFDDHREEKLFAVWDIKNNQNTRVVHLDNVTRVYESDLNVMENIKKYNESIFKSRSLSFKNGIDLQISDLFFIKKIIKEEIKQLNCIENESKLKWLLTMDVFEDPWITSHVSSDFLTLDQLNSLNEKIWNHNSNTQPSDEIKVQLLFLEAIMKKCKIKKFMLGHQSILDGAVVHTDFWLK